MTPADDPDAAPARRRRRGPRKVTASYIENSAAHYLGRFAASSAHLRRVMMAKVDRSARHHGTDPAEGAKFVDDVIAKFERLGFLNDRAFAAMRARGLFAQGTPLRGIRFKLKQQGVAEADIDAALAELSDEEEVDDLDLAAAVKLAERRRLGPFSTADEETRRANRDRDLGRLARAGFSYDIASRVIEAEDADLLRFEAGLDSDPSAL